MALMHDNDGFLQGAAVGLDKRGYARALSVWQAIKADTGAIAKAVGAQTAEVAKLRVATARPGASKAPVLSDRQAAAVARQLAPKLGVAVPRKAAALATSEAVARALAAPTQRPAVPERNQAQARSRGNDGRFAKQAGDKAGEGGGGNGALADVRDGAVGVVQGAEDIDPFFKAAKEVQESIAPFAKFAKGLAKGVWGGGKALVNLFKRKDKDEPAAKSVPWYKKIWRELRTLNKKGGSGGGGGGGLLGGILPLLGGIVGAVAPLVTGLLATAAPLVLPALAVAAAGAIGVAIGSWINGKFGQQISDAIWSASEFIKETWGRTTEWFQNTWKATADGFMSVWETTVKYWSEKATGAKNYVVERTQQAKQFASEKVQQGRDVAGKVWDVTTSGVASLLGKTSAFFESGKGGAGTVSSGKGDHGGASYGTYQLSSKQGTLQRFLQKSGYAEQFAGLQPGTPEFNAKWKQLAASDKGFGAAQHGFIKASHYDPAMAGLQKSGIDLSKRGQAVQDALWSTSVQFGAGDGKKGAVSIFQKALGSKDVASMSDADIVSAVQDYKIANNDQLFSSSSASVRAGTLNRAAAEKAKLVALANGSVANPVMTQAAAAPTLATARLPVARTTAAVPVDKMTPPAMPPARTTLASNDKGRGNTTVTIKQPVGQNLSDRSIAHVATGGLGAQALRS